MPGLQKNDVEKQIVRAMRREPGFLELIAAQIERQQAAKPRTPAELRDMVLAKRKLKNVENQ